MDVNVRHFIFDFSSRDERSARYANFPANKMSREIKQGKDLFLDFLLKNSILEKLVFAPALHARCQWLRLL